MFSDSESSQKWQLEFAFTCFLTKRFKHVIVARTSPKFDMSDDDGDKHQEESENNIYKIDISTYCCLAQAFNKIKGQSPRKTGSRGE